jgi:predicted membrane chloride channel (bestrophin family)
MEKIKNESINTEYKAKTATEEEEELQEKEILNKLINNNNSLNEELRRLDERTASSQNLLKQQAKDLEEIEDRYNQLYIMLEDTLERFQSILEKTNTKDTLKKKTT